MGDGVDVALAGQGEHRRRVNQRRAQELVGQRMPGARPGLVPQLASRPAEQRGPDQGVAVRAQAARVQPHQGIAFARRVRPPGPRRWSFSTTPTAKPGQVHLSNTQLAGVFGQLATEDGAPCLPAAVGDAGHDGGDGVRVKLPPQLVVKEEERLGTLAHEVVYAHGHQVDADGVQPPGLDGYGQLGADAVSRGHQHGLPVPGWHFEQPTEATEAADHFRPGGAGHQRPYERHGPFSGIYVDAGGGVGEGRLARPL